MRVLSAIMFSPRGGSAHVARALAQGLRGLGHSVTLVAGSHSGSGDEADARSFYGDVVAVDFTPALAAKEPLRFEGPPGTAPIHPSYEDRPGAPDRVFAKLGDLDYERQVRAWSRELARAGAGAADVLHLHHLTPLHEAAARVAPHVPVVGHLHGTELLMLEQIDAGPPVDWRHAEHWAERMRGWAQRCARLLVVPGGLERAHALLGVPRERFIPLPGGVDVTLFAPRPVDRARFWREALSESPRGWRPGAPPGSVRYPPAAAAGLADRVVLLYVGRFTAVKRLGLLIAAFGAAAERAAGAAGLVLVGGNPGEWEGEHPAEIVERLHVPDVFLAGWYAHDELPDVYAAADAVVLASEREQFGQVLLEGMACGRPAAATRSVGPASIIEAGRTGWLVGADDPAAFAATLAAVVDDRAERERRGRLARADARARFSWPHVTARFAAVLADVAARVRATY